MSASCSRPEDTQLKSRSEFCRRSCPALRFSCCQRPHARKWMEGVMGKPRMRCIGSPQPVQNCNPSCRWVVSHRASTGESRFRTRASRCCSANRLRHTSPRCQKARKNMCKRSSSNLSFKQHTLEQIVAKQVEQRNRMRRFESLLDGGANM